LQGLGFDNSLFDLIEMSSNIKKDQGKQDVTECGKEEVSC
jgi:hypothetical protein